jgi:hypothetical protein
VEAFSIKNKISIQFALILIFRLLNTAVLRLFYKIACLITVASVLCSVKLLAQDEKKDVIPLERFYTDRTGGSALRRILKNVSFGFSTGYGNTYFSHRLDDFGVYQVAGGSPQIFSATTATRYSNWVNDVITDKTAVSGSAFVANPGTANLGFKGNALTIPLNLFAFYQFKEQYRFGLGYSYELMNIGSMKPTALADQISEFQPSASSGFVGKFYGMLGYSFYRWNEYLFTGDVQIGSFSSTNFNSSFVSTNMYFNLAVTAERELSEYLNVFVRPSFDFKSYAINVPESNKSINHSMNTLYVSVGVTYRIPQLPKCFLKDCHAQIDHAHGNKEYRSRRHPFYKKQNPGYGENDKTLIKYRGKNKKKLNPY